MFLDIYKINSFTYVESLPLLIIAGIVSTRDLKLYIILMKSNIYISQMKTF